MNKEPADGIHHETRRLIAAMKEQAIQLRKRGCARLTLLQTELQTDTDAGLVSGAEVFRHRHEICRYLEDAYDLNRLARRLEARLREPDPEDVPPA